MYAHTVIHSYTNLTRSSSAGAVQSGERGPAGFSLHSSAAGAGEDQGQHELGLTEQETGARMARC